MSEEVEGITEVEVTMAVEGESRPLMALQSYNNRNKCIINRFNIPNSISKA